MTAGSSYYFRFPLISLPSGTNVPLTYKVKLMEYANNLPYPTIISEINYEAKFQTKSATSNTNQWAYLSLSNNQVQKTMSVCLLYTSPSPRDRQKSRMPSSA